MSHQPTFSQRNKRCEPIELYEQVQPEIAVPNRSAHSQSRHVEPSFQSQSVTTVATGASVTAQAVNKRSRFAILIALTTAFLLCLLVVSLVAVILYSPQVRTSSESAADLLSRIEQLERRLEQLQAIQGTNSTLATLTSLQESQESMETSISRLSTSVNSQLNSIQSLSLQNLREDLDRLRSVNLYQGCTDDTRSCTVSTYGNSFYYERACNTATLTVNPHDTQSYATDVRCEYYANYNYLESATVYKSGNNYYCRCAATAPSSTTHTTLPSAYSGTCTLVVTRCPRSVNLLN